MLLTAMLDGSRVDATTYRKEAWSELQESEDRKRMVMPVCGVRAVAKTRGGITKFFAHLRKAGCKVDHGGETPQHLAMKEALSCASTTCLAGTPSLSTRTAPENGSSMSWPSRTTSRGRSPLRCNCHRRPRTILCPFPGLLRQQHLPRLAGAAPAGVPRDQGANRGDRLR